MHFDGDELYLVVAPACARVKLSAAAACSVIVPYHFIVKFPLPLSPKVNVSVMPYLQPVRQGQHPPLVTEQQRTRAFGSVSNKILAGLKENLSCKQRYGLTANPAMHQWKSGM